MLKEHCRDVFFAGGFAANFYAFGFRVLHAAFYARSYHLKLQLGKHACHFHEGLRHRIDLSVPTVYGDAVHDDQPQAFSSDDVDDLTELLCRAGKPADFKCDDRVAFLRCIQKHGEVLLELGIPVLIFKDNSFRSCCFKLADLTVDVLLVLVRGASCIAVCQG